jgi:hypothetical protein
MILFCPLKSPHAFARPYIALDGDIVSSPIWNIHHNHTGVAIGHRHVERALDDRLRRQIMVGPEIRISKVRQKPIDPQVVE